MGGWFGPEANSRFLQNRRSRKQVQAYTLARRTASASPCEMKTQHQNLHPVKYRFLRCRRSKKLPLPNTQTSALTVLRIDADRHRQPPSSTWSSLLFHPTVEIRNPQ